MKKILYFVLIFLFWNLAGFYRSVQLLVLALSWASCGVLLFFCAQKVARQCSAAPAQGWYTARRNRETTYDFFVQNKSRLPVCQVRLQLSACNLPGWQASHFDLFGSVGSRAGQTLTATLVAPACGVTELRLTHLWISDPAGLFAVGKKLDERALLAVLPAVAPLHFVLGSEGGGWHGETASQPDSKGPLQPEQPCSLRDYRFGDPLHFVHWPQTAHSGKLILREPERESQRVLTVLLTARTEELTEFRLRTSYLELAWALLAGVVALPFRVRLLAPTAGVDTELRYPSGLDAVDAALLELYQGWFVTPPAICPDVAPWISALCLDTTLCLTCQGKLLVRFDPANYHRQIAELQLDLSL